MNDVDNNIAHPFSDLIKQRIAQLRPKLMDTSRRNPLINNTLSRNTASFIRIVDEKPQCIWEKIIKEGVSMVLSALPPLETDPPDEENREFRDAYELAYGTDEDFLQKVNEIDRDNDEFAYEKQAKLERQLKDKVRELLGYAPRIESGDATTLHDHARLHRINPSFHLPCPSRC